MDLFSIFRKEPQPKENVPTGEIGYATSQIYMGGDFGKYNPDRLMIKKGNQVYRNMMLDDQVKAALEFKKHAVISREWHFAVENGENGEPDPKQQEIADFLDFMIKHIKGSFTNKLKKIMSAFQNGFSISEVVFQPIVYNNRTYWGIKDIKLRPFETFTFVTDQHDNIEKIQQGMGADSVDIPQDKIIHFVYQSDIDAQYGESDLRAAYRPYWSKDIVIKFQNIHLERHASGFIWGKVTEGSLTTAQETDLKALLNNISARMGAYLPRNVDLNAIQPMRTDAYDRAVVQYDKAIAKSLLVPNMMGLSEQGEKGGYSQSQTQLEAFFWVLDETARRLKETLNDQLFRQLVKWNFAVDDYPEFTFEPISDDKKMAIAAGWNELVKGGSVSKTDSDEAWLRKLVGAPDKPEDEEIDGEPVNPDDLMPVEEPDNEEWIAAQGEYADYIRKEISDKPWLKRVNFVRMEKALDDHDGQFSKELADIMAQVRLSVEKQIERIVGERSMGNVKPKEIEAVKIPAGLLNQYRKTIRTNLQRVLDEGYELAEKELPKVVFKRGARVGMDKTQADRFMSSKSMKITGVMERVVLDGVQNVLENGLKYDKTLKETIDAIGTDTTLVSALPDVDAGGKAINIPARIENIVRTNTADALNQARQSLFGSPDFKGFVLAYEYSAIMDDRTTGVCEALHGIIRKDFANLTPPNHFQCRSILVPVTAIDEWGGKESRIPAAGTPHEGFG